MFDFRSAFKSKFTHWDKLILFIFGLMLFHSAQGFDTGLNSRFIVKLWGLNLLPQEILLILALFSVILRPKSTEVLISTMLGRLMLLFFLIVSIWTLIRIYEGEITGVLVRIYLAWISVPISLCIILRKWENVERSFYMAVVAGFIGAAIMGLTAVLGVHTMNLFFPDIVQTVPEAYNAHIGFIGQSYAWIQLSRFYATACFLFARKRKQRIWWGLSLVLFFVLDIITMGRGRFIFNIFFILFGVTFIVPNLGVKIGKKLRLIVILLMVFLFISMILLGTVMPETTVVGLRERYEAGITQIRAGSGSFAAHYLSPVEKLKQLTEEGPFTLMIGAGPVKNSEIYIYYVRDKIFSVITNNTRNVNPDNYHATLLGWYGLFGLFLMVIIGMISFRKYLQFSEIDIHFRYIGAIGSISFILAGIFVASGSAFEMNSLILVWATLTEHRMRQLRLRNRMNNLKHTGTSNPFKKF